MFLDRDRWLDKGVRSLHRSNLAAVFDPELGNSGSSSGTPILPLLTSVLSLLTEILSTLLYSNLPVLYSIVAGVLTDSPPVLQLLFVVFHRYSILRYYSRYSLKIAPLEFPYFVSFLFFLFNFQYPNYIHIVFPL